MHSTRFSKAIPILADAIDIPNSAYEKSIARYEDIGGWLCRPDSSCSQYAPTVFPQGSFLLGTVTRPSNSEGEYDLDLAVKLEQGISKQTHTQKKLKSLVGRDIEAYRQARGIEQALKEKKRCWRLEYRDQISFHMDILPCIPKSEGWQHQFEHTLKASIADELLAKEIARNAVSITDNERLDYHLISPDWNVSNPQGYGRWFTSRVRLAESTIRDRLRMEQKATIEQIPLYKLKAPLQRCIQLLKVHRDWMFRNAPDQKPISIIITTLAGEAYQGQEDVSEALLYIVENMANYVSARKPRVPNPVYPQEDFADKWYTSAGLELDLEGNFFRWLMQARVDFSNLARNNLPDYILRHAHDSLGLSLDPTHVKQQLGGRTIVAGPPAIIQPEQTNMDPPRPWASP